jgi:hypothetical protein
LYFVTIVFFLFKRRKALISANQHEPEDLKELSPRRQNSKRNSLSQTNLLLKENSILGGGKFGRN